MQFPLMVSSSLNTDYAPNDGQTTVAEYKEQVNFLGKIMKKIGISFLFAVSLVSLVIVVFICKNATDFFGSNETRNDVEFVKNFMLDNDRSMKVSWAFETYKYGIPGTFRQFNSQRNQSVVEYNGDFNIKELTKASKEKFLDKEIVIEQSHTMRGWLEKSTDLRLSMRVQFLMHADGKHFRVGYREIKSHNDGRTFDIIKLVYDDTPYEQFYTYFVDDYKIFLGKKSIESLTEREVDFFHGMAGEWVSQDGRTKLSFDTQNLALTLSHNQQSFKFFCLFRGTMREDIIQGEVVFFMDDDGSVTISFDVLTDDNKEFPLILRYEASVNPKLKVTFDRSDLGEFVPSK